MEVMKKQQVKVENMTCGHCKMKIEKIAVEQGGKNVHVDLQSGLLEFESDDEAREKVIGAINETEIYKAR
ncbi:MAG: heavy-metal-associated domain-containing protein [Bacteroidota bacterium]